MPAAHSTDHPKKKASFRVRLWLDQHGRTLSQTLPFVVGPLFSVLVALSLSLAAPLAVLVVIISFFLLVILSLIRAEFMRIESRLVSQLSSRYTTRLVRERQELYEEHARQLKESTDTIRVLGIGADLREQQWRERIEGYRDQLVKALQRGVKVKRVQVLHDAPISWLQYIAELRKAYPNFYVRFTEDLKNDVFQLMMNDDREFHILLRIRTSPAPEEVCLFVTDSLTVSLVRQYFDTTLWGSASFEVAESQFEAMIQDIILSRTSALKETMKRHMLAELKAGRLSLRWPSDDDTFIGKRDGYLVDILRKEAEAIWNNLNARKSEALLTQAIDAWIQMAPPNVDAQPEESER